MIFRNIMFWGALINWVIGGFIIASTCAFTENIFSIQTFQVLVITFLFGVYGYLMWIT